MLIQEIRQKISKFDNIQKTFLLIISLQNSHFT